MPRARFHSSVNHIATRVAIISVTSLLAALIFPFPSHAQTPVILVGPNILVSKSSDSPRVELMIAANPKNPRNLIGTAIVSERDANRCKTYTSFDGGYSWRETTVADLPENGSGDPQIAFAPDGTAYFSALGDVPSEDGKIHFVVMLFRSEDGGLTWQKTAVYGAGYAPDHDQMVIDGRAGAGGKIYVAVGHRTDLEEMNIGVFRSDERGKAVVGPLHVTGGAGRGLFSLNPVVFSDGSLFVPFISSERKPLEKRNPPSTDIYFALSHDSGYTFATPAKIRTQVLDPNYNVGSPYASVVFAVDSSGRFRDRIYMTWGEAAGGHYHVKLSYSNDKGKTWSVRREIGEPRADTNQFRPAMAVSNQGVIGISWFDTRDTTTGRQYNEFFTASTDGGETFLPPARVSSRSSSLDAPGNLILWPTTDSPRLHSGAISFSFDTTGFRFPDAGEYQGLAADANGIFHPFWADSRDGSYQAWTAAVKIELRERGAEDAAVTGAFEAQVTEKIWPLFDPAHFDAQTGIEEIPVRLKNISEQTICRPLVAQINGAETGKIASNGTEILNSDDGKGYKGARFDYSSAIGDFSCLAPGEATAAIVWRVKPTKNAKSFVSFEITVTGVMAHPER